MDGSEELGTVVVGGINVDGRWANFDFVQDEKHCSTRLEYMKGNLFMTFYYGVHTDKHSHPSDGSLRGISGEEGDKPVER